MDQFVGLENLALTQKTDTAYLHKHFLLTVKHGGGGVMSWVWFAARTWAPWSHWIMYEILCPISDKNFSWNWMSRQDKWPQAQQQWPFQTQDFNTAETQGPQRSVHKQMPVDLAGKDGPTT